MSSLVNIKRSSIFYRQILAFALLSFFLGTCKSVGVREDQLGSKVSEEGGEGVSRKVDGVVLNQYGETCPGQEWVHAKDLWEASYSVGLERFFKRLNAIEDSQKRREELLRYLSEEFMPLKKDFFWGFRNEDSHILEHPVSYLLKNLGPDEIKILNEKLNPFVFRLADSIYQFRRDYEALVSQPTPPSQKELKKALDELEAFVAWSTKIERSDLMDLKDLYLRLADLEKDRPVYRGSLLNWESKKRSSVTLAECYKTGGDVLSSPSFSADGRWLAVGSDDNHLHVFSLVEYEGSQELRWEKSAAFETGGEVDSSPSFSADGRWLAVGSNDYRLHVFSLAEDVNSKELRWEKSSAFKTGGEVGSSPSFSPDGRWLAVGSDDYHLHVFSLAEDVNSKELRWEKSSAFKTEGYVISSPSFSSDGRWLAVGSSDDHLHVFSLTEDMGFKELRWEKSSAFKTGSSVYSSPSFSPDGSWLAVGSRDNHLHVFSLAEDIGSKELRWEKLSGFKTGGSVYSSPSFSPDGRWLSVGSGDGHLYIFQMP